MKKNENESEMHANQERELKLRPDDPALLDRLAQVDQLGELTVRDRSRQLQRNSFFDTASRALGKAHLGFRRRLIDGQPGLATWSVKADGVQVAGVATRTEIELRLDADMPPALALDALGQAARQRNAPLVAEQLADALASSRELPLARPVLETQTDRRIVNLESAAHGWQVELALDRVHLLGHAYTEVEIEAELKHGDVGAFEEVRRAIGALGSVHNADGSKLSRAHAHLAQCQCGPRQAGQAGQTQPLRD